jgi:hypothetical protein
VLIIVFVVGLSTFSYHRGSLKAAENTKPPQFEIIELDFKIYTVRGHEYLGKDNVGLVHIVDCKTCEIVNKIYIVRGHEYLGKDNLGLVHMVDCKTCEIAKLEKQERLKNLVDKAVSQ